MSFPLLVAVSLAWGAGPAVAGQYTVWSCRGPQGAPISTAAWRIQIANAAAPEVTSRDDCAGGGSLRLEMNPGATISGHQPSGEALFEPPPGTLIPSFRLWRYAAADDGPNTPEGEDDFGAGLREWLVEGGGEGFLEECGVGRTKEGTTWHDCHFGTPLDPLAPANLVDEHTWVAETEPGEGVPARERLSLWVGCVRANGGCEPPAGGPGALVQMFGSAIVIEDDRAPTIERLEGSLAAAPPVSGTGTLFVTAADPGGGVAAFEFSVDGGAPRRVTTANGAGGCEEPFSLPQPCPTTATKGFLLDTATLAPGGHTLSGAVIDAAGNSTPFGPLAFTVAAPEAGGPRPEAGVARPEAGVAPPVAEDSRPNNGNPAVVFPRLRVHATSPRQVGGPGRLHGTLTTRDGSPIAGARLRVEVTELGGGQPRQPRTVWTDAHGHFAFGIAAAGARSVVVSFSPTFGGPVARSADAVVKSPLSLRLKTRPHRVRNGRTVHFVGRLRGAGRAARGATVEIQAVAAGRWTTVETVTAGARGSFRWSHRFRYVERNALFSFRAVVPRTPGWPWSTARSPRIKVPIKGAVR